VIAIVEHDRSVSLSLFLSLPTEINLRNQFARQREEEEERERERKGEQGALWHKMAKQVDRSAVSPKGKT